jgi:hypothetical protein
MSLLDKHDLYLLPKEILIEKIIPEIEKSLRENEKSLRERISIMDCFIENEIVKYKCAHQGCDQYAYSNIQEVCMGEETWIFKEMPVGKTYNPNNLNNYGFWVVTLDDCQDPLPVNKFIEENLRKTGVICLYCCKWTCMTHFKENILIEGNEMVCNTNECAE